MKHQARQILPGFSNSSAETKILEILGAVQPFPAPGWMQPHPVLLGLSLLLSEGIIEG